MNQTKGLTLKDFNHINSTCRSIAKCDKYGIKSKELRQQIYFLGLYTFRQFHKAGLPLDYMEPSLNQPSRELNGYNLQSERIHNSNSNTQTSNTFT